MGLIVIWKSLEQGKEREKCHNYIKIPQIKKKQKEKIKCRITFGQWS